MTSRGRDAKLISTNTCLLPFPTRLVTSTLSGTGPNTRWTWLTFAIHAATLIGRQPERYGFSVVPEEPLRYEQVTVPKGSRLVRLAALSGVALQDLEQLNPELRQKQAPPDTAYELKVPLGTTAAVQTAIELDVAPRKAPPAPRPGIHVVQSGDTVWRIARQYGVTPKQLAQWNGLERPDRIFPGDRLRVAILAAAS